MPMVVKWMIRDFEDEILNMNSLSASGKIISAPEVQSEFGYFSIVICNKLCILTITLANTFPHLQKFWKKHKFPLVLAASDVTLCQNIDF